MSLGKSIKRHLRAMTIAFRVWYPDHEERNESSTYRATRRRMISDNPDAACMVCGSKKHLELHHWYVEWSFSNAVDWDTMRALHPDFDWNSFHESEDFVDSDYNCRVLCRSHHRLHGTGIHNLPYPVWLEQRHDPDNWEFAAPRKKD